ncbi:tRNA lysidine(34) synthetase TilS [Bacillus rubiinfantis]|uniref:tRNA lysidine(34) synthetase TilS n=1 Tax=Bacillus rubiinfantis TaxID=1499680 RepID=UPI0005A7E0C9|nr:tRNA lysidine(34) synthetase TilS [Bacillus rubiinfantis]
MLETKVRDFLFQHGFNLENKRIVVGVSGGPDSLALLHYLLCNRDKNNLFIVAAHIDHMFRGQESYEDAMFVSNFCKQHQIPFEMSRVNVPELMQETGNSPETAGREARYEFYAAIMAKHNASYVALAHHGDDQIETILMRLTRGSTGMARAGIRFLRPFQSGMIFRPFLCVTKADINQYCQRHQLDPRMDPSNQEGVYSRNRYRLQVLPFLKQENPQVHEQFQRFSEDLLTDESYLQELTVHEMNRVMRNKVSSEITIDITRFSQMPLPLQRRGIQLILNYLYKEKPTALSALHIDQVFHLINHGKPSGKLDFPEGLKVYRSYGDLTFSFHGSKQDAKPFYVVMDEPGDVQLPNGARIQITCTNQEISQPRSKVALFAADRIKWPIIIRTRKTGDRMTVKGMQGTKKLKDIFINQKVPLQERNTWPVVTDGEDCIIWLPEIKKSALEGIQPTAKYYIQLTYDK